MSKKINAVLKDNNIVELKEPGEVGDFIDLNSISGYELDTKKFYDEINNEKEKAFAQRLSVELAKKTKEVKDLEELKSKKDLAEKESEIENLKRNLNLEKEKARLEAENSVTKNKQGIIDDLIIKINQAKIDLQSKTKELQTLEETIDLKIKNRELEISKEKDSYINSLELQLTAKRVANNIKKMGEELENWCFNEYQEAANYGFDNCVFEKDNAVKDNTKGDFIFSVFDDNKLLLSSVMCEMKTESRDSTNKKKNKDHFSKLDSDRTKKGCEYALLVSELEMDADNCLSVQKVKEYANMYIVRPMYFISFLGLVKNLVEKNREIVVELSTTKRERAADEEIENRIKEIKDDFNLNIEKIAKKAEEILSEADKIHKSSNKIIAHGEMIVNSHIKALSNKIQKFTSKKILK